MILQTYAKPSIDLHMLEMTYIPKSESLDPCSLRDEKGKYSLKHLEYFYESSTLKILDTSKGEHTRKFSRILPDKMLGQISMYCNTLALL